MKTSKTAYGMSSKCKYFVAKKVYEHYVMNIFWREVCQKISTICIFIFPLLSVVLENKTDALEYTIIILSGLVSLIATFFCDTKDYYTSLHIVRDAYMTQYDDRDFERKFKLLMPYIREIDFARGRSDYSSHCKELKISQNLCDRLTKHDVDEMNRQRLIIAVLCIIAVFVCILMILSILEIGSLAVLILFSIVILTIVGFVFMLVDSGAFSKKKEANKDVNKREK